MFGKSKDKSYPITDGYVFLVRSMGLKLMGVGVLVGLPSAMGLLVLKLTFNPILTECTSEK